MRPSSNDERLERRGSVAKSSQSWLSALYAIAAVATVPEAALQRRLAIGISLYVHPSLPRA